MNMRIIKIISTILTCILLYSFVDASWLERIKVLFFQKKIADTKTTEINKVAFLYDVKTKMESHLALGKTLLATIHKEKKDNKVSAINAELEHRFALWQLYAQALITVIDKKRAEQIKSQKTKITIELFSTLVSQLERVTKPVRYEEYTKKMVDVAVEKIFASLFAEKLLEITKFSAKITTKNYKNILQNILLWVASPKTIDSYITLTQEARISLFDALAVLIHPKLYQAVAQQMAQIIKNMALFVRESAMQSRTTINAVTDTHKQLELVRPFITSTFEIIGKNFINLETQYMVLQDEITYFIQQAIQKEEKNGVFSEKFISDLLQLSASDDKKILEKRSPVLRKLLFNSLRPFTKLCEEKSLQSSFLKIISLFSLEKNIKIMTSDNILKKDIVPIRMLLLTLHAVIDKCIKNKKTDIKTKLDMIKTAFYKAPTKYREEEAKQLLLAELTTQAKTISDAVTKNYSNDVKQFLKLFLVDSFDVKAFFEQISKESSFQKKLETAVNTKDENRKKQQQTVLFREYKEKFSRFIQEKYQFIQQLYTTLSAEIKKTYKNIDQPGNLLLTWLLSDPLVYEKARKEVRNAIIKNEKTSIITMLTDEFRAILPFLAIR